MSKRAVPTFDHVPETVTAEDADFFMEAATDVALVALQGLLASGKDPKAAVGIAWNDVVPEFMRQQALFPTFLNKIYGVASPQPKTDA